MSHKRRFLSELPILAVTVSLVTIVSLGGCPVAQQPTTPPADANSTANQPGFLPNNTRSDARPIPPLPAADTSSPDGSGQTLPGTPSVPEIPEAPQETPGQAQALRVTVLGPNTNIEVRRNEAVEIEYRVDGDAQNIELVFDVEGGQSGVVAQSGLNVEGTVVFSTADPGIYSFRIRAVNADSDVSQNVPATVTVVGDMTLNFSKPSRNLIVRPNVPVAVSYAVDTLAASISSEVFVDPDVNVDGDETRVFTSILKSVDENFLTQGLLLGVNYTIYAVVTDSVGQITDRIVADNTFRIVPVPTINVTAPTGDETIESGDPVTVEFAAIDTENIATITVFVDTDGIFNGDEDVLVSDLPISDTSYEVDTSSLIAGSYHFGAWVADPDTGDIFNHDYAGGSRTIPGLNISTPIGDTTLRTPNTLELRWTATYPAASFASHEVVIALDADNDGQPDGPLQTVQAGFVPGPNTFQVPTVGLKGRYLLGVRLIDNNSREIVSFAAGHMVVLNDAPTVLISQPSDFIAVRPGTPESQIRMNFFIGDTEGQTGLLDIDVVVARDDVEPFGVPDGSPVFTQRDSSFRIGLNGNFTFDADQLQPLINDSQHDGFGWFLLGVRVVDDAGQQALAWTPGLYVDDVIPAIALDAPTERLVIKDKIGTLDVQLTVTDTSPTFVRVLMDRELNPNNPFNGFELVPWTLFQPNQTQQFVIDLTDPSIQTGFFFYYLEVADPAGTTAHFLPPGENDPFVAKALWIRNRLIGIHNVDDILLDDEDPGKIDGGILQGVQFNDLGGSSMASVADVDNDGDDEFIVVSRYGKPFVINNSIGVGFGEAFLVYGNGGNNNIDDPQRLSGAQSLNAIGRGSIRGLSFPGIRIPLNATAGTTGMTEGMADVAVVEDMDGDELPEIVFSFPRVESINLGTTDSTVQHPELLPDLPNMGNLEYNALGPFGWIPNTAQFTRGGIVIVSSHNTNITNENVRNRKSDRLIDLHEIGQMFTDMSRPSLKPYIISAVPNLPPQGQLDCDMDGNPDLIWNRWIVQWDVVFGWDGTGPAHGPGGFHMPWTAVSADPPLANPTSHPPLPPYLFYPDIAAPSCLVPVPECEAVNVPWIWPPQPFLPFPCSQRANVVMWDVGGGVSHWTAFAGQNPDISIRNFGVGARVLGQKVDDRFGSAVSSDRIWLYMSAPRHTVTVADVPNLRDAPGTRDKSGVVYQYRIDTRTSEGARTRSQLWMEPGTTWPEVDIEGAKGDDTTMPTPHQYIIETVGSTRGNPPGGTYNFGGTCPPSYNAGSGGAQAPAATGCYQPSVVGTAAFYMDRTPQIVGPHVNAEISFVRNVGDVNDDGLEDFAVGSDKIMQDFTDPQNPSGSRVGGIFIVYSRSSGNEGDYLLEDLARSPGDQRRLAGVVLLGESDGQNIARVFDGAGDFNGDGIDDVIVGSENGSFGKGEAILIFGSRTLLSPEGGFTLAEIVTEGRAIRFIGAADGDLAGASVAGAGDVDFDHIDDILISAPNANPLNNPDGAPGAVYLIYGAAAYQDAGVIDLAQVGTPAVPGVVFVGRNVGDSIGAGSKELVVNPDLQPTKAFSRGLAALGDIDGDGRADYAISSILADPFGKTDAGEIYVIYGKGDRSIFAP